MNEILERIKSFLQRNVGSSVCVRSREQSLLKRVRGVVAELTKEYLIFTEPSIDEVRQAEEFLYTASGDGMKIVVFEKFERSSMEAMNAFLKTLEEPPHTVWLCSPRSSFVSCHRLFEAGSRCLTSSFREVSTRI